MNTGLSVLFFVFCFTQCIHSQCVSYNQDFVAPPASFSYTLPNQFIERGYSEIVEPRNMPLMNIQHMPWPRVNCPHLQNGLLNWEDESTWVSTLGHIPTTSDEIITLPSNSKVLIKNCSITNNINNPFQLIVVPETSELIFDDSDLEFHAREIRILGGGLKIGSPICRLYGNIRIVLHGDRSDSSVVNDDGLTSKGIDVVDGVLDVHGKQYHPTWTRLGATVDVGDDIIFLQDAVNWEVGQEILLTTSKWFDCPPEYQNTWCESQPHQNEIKKIKNIDNLNGVIQVETPFTFDHYSGTEYQTEVALLSRRIVIEGTQTGDQYGAHVRVSGQNGQMRISGTSCKYCGQLNIIGRYPFHFHMMGSSPQSYFEDNTVQHSNFRSYVIHGTNDTRLSRNVAYDVYGMSFYLEDGVEEGNVLEYNLAAHTHPILEPSGPVSGGVSGGSSFFGSVDRILPADSSASGFYVSNCYNVFIGNAASGGWSGFAFPNIPFPLNEHHGVDNGFNNPIHRPNMENGFVGNTAHSSGFYWGKSGSCFYTGGWLEFDEAANELWYMSGREQRDTYDSNGNEMWMKFIDTKAWLCNRGINHWGHRAVIEYYESHDNLRASITFGESALKYVLINARSGNVNGHAQQDYLEFREGFEFYDTWVKTILSYVTFRNFDQPENGDRVFTYMTHSDEFLNQGINAVRGIVYENCHPDALVKIPNCGPICGDTTETMSATVANVYDYDGTFSQTNIPSIIGTHRDWWNISSQSCSYIDDYNVYRCDWNSYRKIVYVEMRVDGIYDGCDNASPLNTGTCVGQSAPYRVGYVSQWGNDKKLELSPFPGVTGISSTGWYWRTPWGAPSSFSVGESKQIPRGSFIVLAIRYPPSAQFTVRMRTQQNRRCNCGKTYPAIPMASTKEEILAPTEDINDVSEFSCPGGTDFCTNYGGVGPSWFFDGEYIYLRVVNFICYRSDGYLNCENNYYTADDMKVYDLSEALSYDVQVTCPGCTISNTYQGVDYFEVDDINVPTEWDVLEEIVPIFSGQEIQYKRNISTDIFFTDSGQPTENSSSDQSDESQSSGETSESSEIENSSDEVHVDLSDDSVSGECYFGVEILLVILSVGFI